MKKPRNEVKRQWRISSANVKKGLYISIGVPRIDNKGYEIRLGYGYVEDLKKYHDDPVQVIKTLIADFPLSWSREQARERLDELFKNKNSIKKEIKEKYIGWELIEKLFNYFEIFSNQTGINNISIKDYVFKLLNNKLPLMIFSEQKFDKKENSEIHSQNSFYDFLDYIADNETRILENINEAFSKIRSENVDISRFEKIQKNSKTLHESLSNKQVYLPSQKTMRGFVCLCQITSLLINYLVLILNSWLLKYNKPKISVSKIINVINDVKEIQIFMNDNLLESTPMWNENIKDSWEIYQSILEILKIKNIM